MIRILLAIAGALAPVIRVLGGDPAQFVAILETKLTLDSRRPMIGLANRKDRESGGAFTGAMTFYGLIGIFVGGILWRVNSPLVGLTIVNTTVLIMLTMTLIADFTSVLLDTTDNAILQPRPVSSRTLFLARTAHIFIYLGLLSLSLSLVTLGLGTLRWGCFFAPLYLLTLLGSLMLAICVASLFYLVAMRFAGRERIRDIVIYVQIVFSVIIFAGSQVLPRLVDTARIEYTTIESARWIYFYPPAWLAAPLDLLAGHAHRPQWILTLLACTVPPVALFVVVWGLASRFNQMLAAMDLEEGGRGDAAMRGRGDRSFAASPRHRVPASPRRLSLIPVPRSLFPYFEFLSTLLSRDRIFKQRVYPSVAMLFIVPFGILLSDHRGLGVVLRELPSTHRYLFVLYLAAASFAPAIVQLRYSPHWQAAWIYEALPIARPGEILIVGLAVIFLRFVLPVYILLSAILVSIWGPRILPDILLTLEVTVALSLVEGILLGRHLPFSEQFGVREGSGRFGKNLALLALAAGLGYGHLFLKTIPWGIPVVLLATLILIVALARVYRQTTWESLT